MKKLYANLHSHSTHSDGVYSPTEMANVAKKEGYGAIAITDHDVITGYPELKLECDRIGMKTLFGVEFSSPFSELNTTYHMTAFNFDSEYPPIKQYLEERSYCETYQTRVLFERGVSLNLISGITWDEVLDFNKGITWLCNEHVFRAMKAKGLVTDIDHIPFFRSVFGKHREEVKLPFDFKPGREIIKLVHDAGGIIIIAHPAGPYGSVSQIEDLVRMGADGVEVWHGLMTTEDKKEALRQALKYNLYISGGSDHDGLCGGLYSRFVDPTTTRHFAPECSLGTTKEFFEEISNMKKLPERRELIEYYIEGINV